ncbi:p-hydroxybenzoic acid efflux pump subunit AaeA [Halomonadaceae bacterium LMG 33818]|uniref:efflux RND transporter periplasmic adaptor subunit n=1 Tax=Cernens ardua TaxID=3402176 RepID=UPI003EDBBB89
MRTLARLIFTFIMLAIAVTAGIWIWKYYQYTPWTRDGRVRADVITIAPDVSGWITQLNVADNTWVNTGDVIFRIDSARYKAALDQAKAQAMEAKITWQRSQSDYQRRLQLSSQSISREALETYQLNAAAAYATYQADQAAVETAQINLDRTVYRAPYSGYVVNLALRQGDYVSKGVADLSLIRADSFYVTGYFEETKIPSIRPGMKADIWLMSGNKRLQGHVVSIGRGISNDDASAGNEHLPNVAPSFTWVRLAQRIPVDVVFDAVPKDVILSSGMTATVRIVQPKQHRNQYYNSNVTRGTSSKDATPEETVAPSTTTHNTSDGVNQGGGSGQSPYRVVNPNNSTGSPSANSDAIQPATQG